METPIIMMTCCVLSGCKMETFCSMQLLTKVLSLCAADVTTTLPSLTLAAVSADTDVASSSSEQSALSSSHRTSPYRSKHLRGKEQEQDESSARPSKDTISVSTVDQKDGTFECC